MPDATQIDVSGGSSAASSAASTPSDGSKPLPSRPPPALPPSRPARPAAAAARTTPPTVQVQSVTPDSDSSPVVEMKATPPVPVSRPSRPPGINIQSPEEKPAAPKPNDFITESEPEAKARPSRRAPPVPKARNGATSAINEQQPDKTVLDTSLTEGEQSLPPPMLPSRPPRPAAEVTDKYAVFRDAFEEDGDAPSADGGGAPPPVPSSRPQRPTAEGQLNLNNSAATTITPIPLTPVYQWPGDSASSTSTQAASPSNPFDAKDDWASQAGFPAAKQATTTPSPRDNPFGGTDDWASQATNAPSAKPTTRLPPPPIPTRPRPK